MAPIPIEDAIKEEGELRRLSGDNRKHLAVIITLKTVLDKDNQPTEIHDPEVQHCLHRPRTVRRAVLGLSRSSEIYTGRTDA